MKEYTNWDDAPLLLGVAETATITGYGRARIRELCRAKAMPCIHLGRAYRIPKDALQNWIASSSMVQTGDLGSTYMHN